MIISGRHEIEEALKNDVAIVKIIIPKFYHLPVSLYQEFRDEKIPIIELEKSVFQNKYPGQDSIVALCDDLPIYPLDEVIETLPDRYSRILLMEEIEDPQNAGAMIRSAACFGFHGAVITKRHSTLLAKGAMSASSGSALHLKITRVNNMNQTLALLKERGYWIVGLDIRGKESPRQVNYHSHIAVVVGNEELGLHKKTAEHCDHLVRVPINPTMDSLNVSVAFGIVGYEIHLQDKIIVDTILN